MDRAVGTHTHWEGPTGKDVQSRNSLALTAAPGQKVLDTNALGPHGHHLEYLKELLFLLNGPKALCGQSKPCGQRVSGMLVACSHTQDQGESNGSWRDVVGTKGHLASWEK